MIDPLRRLRLERAALHLYHLGPRAVCEFLDALIQRTNDPQPIFDQLDSYNRLTPAMVRAAGGDRLPARTLRLVQA